VAKMTYYMSQKEVAFFFGMWQAERRQGNGYSFIEAVNEGAVFRFLTKPCRQDLLTKTLDAALEQFRLVTAERELLRETLMGTV
jgi:hypothetical protein